MFKRLFVLVVFLVAVISCGPSQDEYDAALKKNRENQEEISRLKNEISDLKYGAEILLINAKNNYGNKNYDAAMSSLEQIFIYHPASKEAKTAKVLLAQYKEEKELQNRKEWARKQSALKRMNKNHDAVEGISWFRDPGSLGDSSNRIYLYFGADKGGSLVGPRLVINFKRSISLSWLFITKYNLKIDDTNEEIIPANYNDIKRDNSAYNIWEEYDVFADANIIRIVKKIIHSKKTILRYVGQDYVSDRIISSNEKAQLQNVLDAFNAYKEKI